MPFSKLLTPICVFSYSRMRCINCTMFFFNWKHITKCPVVYLKEQVPFKNSLQHLEEPHLSVCFSCRIGIDFSFSWLQAQPEYPEKNPTVWSTKELSRCMSHPWAQVNLESRVNHEPIKPIDFLLCPTTGHWNNRLTSIGPFSSLMRRTLWSQCHKNSELRSTLYLWIEQSGFKPRWRGTLVAKARHLTLTVPLSTLVSINSYWWT